jgi:GDP-L-fucose synthase
MPTNLYGPNDRYDLDTSHVIPALIRKFHEAKNTDADRVVVWGTGNPRREFLYSDDAAEACIFLMSIAEEKFAKLALGNDMPPTVNIGWGEDVSIRELASLVAKIVGFENDIAFDPSKPDGTPRKLLDVSVLTALGWRPRVKLHDGLRQTYEHFRQSVGERFMAEVVPQQG